MRWVAKGVAARRFSDAGFDAGVLESALEDGFVEMMPPPRSGEAVGIVAGGGKDPLPAPLLVGVGVFAAERVRQLDRLGLVRIGKIPPT